MKALEPITIQEAYADKEEIGTITLKTNRIDLNAFQVYSIYKQREAIEQFFKTYGDTMSYKTRNQLKTMNRQFGFYMDQKTAMKNNLIALLDQTYPGARKVRQAYERPSSRSWTAS